MSPILVKILTVMIPVAVATLLSFRTQSRLANDPLIGEPAPRAFMVFIVARALYWLSFGMLITAFALARLLYPMGGEATRSSIANNTATELKPFTDVLSSWGVVLVPASLFTIFVAIGALFVLGRAGLRAIPEEAYQSREFKRGIATFFFMGFSLMAPPLFFSLLFSF